MQLARPAFAPDPRIFGRGRVLRAEVPAAPSVPTFRLTDDAKLFAATFLGGFLFVSILIG